MISITVQWKWARRDAGSLGHAPHLQASASHQRLALLAEKVLEKKI